MAAPKAMTADVMARFSIHHRRVYTEGMSGGARVAMKIALDSEQMSGVFASSAGFPDEMQGIVGAAPGGVGRTVSPSRSPAHGGLENG